MIIMLIDSFKDGFWFLRIFLNLYKNVLTELIKYNTNRLVSYSNSENFIPQTLTMLLL